MTVSEFTHVHNYALTGTYCWGYSQGLGLTGSGFDMYFPVGPSGHSIVEDTNFVGEVGPTGR